MQEEQDASEPKKVYKECSFGSGNEPGSDDMAGDFKAAGRASGEDADRGRPATNPARAGKADSRAVVG